MKTILFGKPNAKKFKAFKVEDGSILSIITPKKDKKFAEFLFSLQLNPPIILDPRITRQILNELGIDEKEPPSDNSLDMDNILMRVGFNNLFDKDKNLPTTSRYMENYFKRHTDKLNAIFGYPVLIISQYDDIDDLPETYNTYERGKNTIYSILNEEQTNKLINVLEQLGEIK